MKAVDSFAIRPEAMRGLLTPAPASAFSQPKDITMRTPDDEWQAAWNQGKPKPKRSTNFVVDEKVWVRFEAPYGEGPLVNPWYYKPARIVRRSRSRWFSRYYRVRYASGKQRWAHEGRLSRHHPTLAEDLARGRP